MKRFYSLFFTLFFVPLFSGFDASTLVWLSEKSLFISQVAKGSELVTIANNRYATRMVLTPLLSYTAIDYYIIYLPNDRIVCSPLQFFLTTSGRWKSAYSLEKGDLLTGINPIPVIAIKRQEQAIRLYDFVIDGHTFCVGKHKVVVHNFAPFIGLSISLLFGTGAVEWSLGLIGGISAFGAVIGFAVDNHNKNKKHKIVAAPVCRQSHAHSSGNHNDDEDDDKKRIINTMSKTEYLKKIKKEYRYDHQTGAYRRINRAKGIKCSRTQKDVEYIKWDGQHGDVEAYGQHKDHLGSIDPATGKMYKGPVYGRTIKK